MNRRLAADGPVAAWLERLKFETIVTGKPPGEVLTGTGRA